MKIQEETVVKIEFFDNMIRSIKTMNKEHQQGMMHYMNMMIKKYFDTIELKKLKDICKIEQGTGLNKVKIIDGDYPVIGGGKIIGYHNKFNREGNELVITRVGDLKINFFEIKYYLTDNGFSIKSENVKYIYYYLLNNNILEKYYNGSGQKL